MRKRIEQPVVTLAGHGAAYHSGEGTRCPQCSGRNWHIGRTTAECAFCSCALPIALETAR